MPTYTFNPGDLENKSFPGIPYPGGKWGNNTFHHNRVASLSYASGIGTPGANLRFGPKFSFWTSPRPPCTFTPISREQEFSQDTDPPPPVNPARGVGGHSTTPMGYHQNLKPGTSVRLCRWKVITHAYEHIYHRGSREQRFSRDTDPPGGKWGNNTYPHKRVTSQS